MCVRHHRESKSWLAPHRNSGVEFFSWFLYFWSQITSTTEPIVRTLFKMTNSLCLRPVCSFKPPNKSGLGIGNSIAGKVIPVNKVFQGSKTSKFQSLEVKAADSDKDTKPRGLVCADCDGNGKILCSQCEGTGVNSKDYFNGNFKAGGLCWLCRGKRDILCGTCNGAGFIGGFMSTFDS